MDAKNGSRISPTTHASFREDKTGIKPNDLIGIHIADDALLAELGYKSEFKARALLCSRVCVLKISPLARVLGTFHILTLEQRDWFRAFQLIETIAFAFSIMGVVASVTSTFSFPLVSGTVI
jgi:hypothetical protein